MWMYAEHVIKVSLNMMCTSCREELCWKLKRKLHGCLQLSAAKSGADRLHIINSNSPGCCQYYLRVVHTEGKLPSATITNREAARKARGVRSSTPCNHLETKTELNEHFNQRFLKSQREKLPRYIVIHSVIEGIKIHVSVIFSIFDGVICGK